MNAKQANRAKRRQMQYGDRDERLKKVEHILQPLTKEQRVLRLEKALEEERMTGFEIGKNGAIDYTFKCIYAAVLLACKKLYGIDGNEGKKILNEIDQLVIWTLTEQ